MYERSHASPVRQHPLRGPPSFVSAGETTRDDRREVAVPFSRSRLSPDATEKRRTSDEVDESHFPGHRRFQNPKVVEDPEARRHRRRGVRSVCASTKHVTAPTITAPALDVPTATPRTSRRRALPRPAGLRPEQDRAALGGDATVEDPKRSHGRTAAAPPGVAGHERLGRTGIVDTSDQARPVTPRATAPSGLTRPLISGALRHRASRSAPNCVGEGQTRRVSTIARHASTTLSSSKRSMVMPDTVWPGASVPVQRVATRSRSAS
jgi:hypothetical protein